MIADWYAPIESKHKNVTWVYRYLKELLFYLENNNLNTSTVNEKINYWFSIHPEDGIDDLIDSLHDLMFNYLDTPDGSQSKETHLSTFKTYRTLRTFLNELKIIEREINIKKGVIVIN